MTLAPETILQNRYRIVRQLGQGGMGTVYEALDLRLDTTVALKETHSKGERLLKQFEREAQLLARLQHPALPRVSDHFTEGDGQFLVMQFVAGEDLGEALQRRGGEGFAVGEVLKWGDELLDALEYLHAQDPPVVHRDIKPQNLKLSERGQVILLDFGLAKGLPGQASSATTAASVFGYTLHYAPLEQIRGESTDAGSDLYSLGATLYHLLTGVAPPDALKRLAALSEGDEDPLAPAHKANPHIPAGVSEVLHQAMRIANKSRPASAAEMRRALRDAEACLRRDGSEAKTVLLPATTEPLKPSPPTQPLRTVPSTEPVRRVAPAGLSTSLPGAKRSSYRLLLIAGIIALLTITVAVAYKFSDEARRVNSGREPVVNRDDAARLPGQSDLEKNAAAGRQLFQSLDCVRCHGNKGEGKIGPALAGILGEEVRLTNEVTTIADESYIRESILVPKARVVAGYKPIMPSFQGQLTDEQVSQLVAYIVSLSPPKPRGDITSNDSKVTGDK